MWGGSGRWSRNEVKVTEEGRREAGINSCSREEEGLEMGKVVC